MFVCLFVLESYPRNEWSAVLWLILLSRAGITNHYHICSKQKAKRDAMELALSPFSHDCGGGEGWEGGEEGGGGGRWVDKQDTLGWPSPLRRFRTAASLADLAMAWKDERYELRHSRMFVSLGTAKEFHLL